MLTRSIANYAAGEGGSVVGTWWRHKIVTSPIYQIFLIFEYFKAQKNILRPISSEIKILRALIFMRKFFGLRKSLKINFSLNSNILRPKTLFKANFLLNKTFNSRILFEFKPSTALKTFLGRNGFEFKDKVGLKFFWAIGCLNSNSFKAKSSLKSNALRLKNLLRSNFSGINNIVCYLFLCLNDGSPKIFLRPIFP